LGRGWLVALVAMASTIGGSGAACAPDFDTVRVTGTRGTL
jgi:hypothetical protein